MFYLGIGHSSAAYAANIMAVATFLLGAVVAGRIVRGPYGDTRFGFFIICRDRGWFRTDQLCGSMFSCFDNNVAGLDERYEAA
jgi:hypothetical protein